MEEQRERQKFNIGDILVCSWGYEQTNIDFYQIVKLTEKMATVRKIESHGFEHESSMTGTVKPLKDKFTGAPLKRKIQRYDGEIYIRVSDYGTARPWDGKPQRFSSYA